jgi:histone deacetylase 6
MALDEQTIAALTSSLSSVTKNYTQTTQCNRVGKSRNQGNLDETKSDVDEKENEQKPRTGLIFQSSDGHFDRHRKFHWERAQRIHSIREHIFRPKNPNNIEKRCLLLKDSDFLLKLEKEDYVRVHFPGYIARLDSLQCLSMMSSEGTNRNTNLDDSICKSKKQLHVLKRLEREAQQYNSIYLSPHSIKEAKQAASALCQMVSHVVCGKLKNGFAITRPPGHHAEPASAGGYCLINNVAVATAYARGKLGVKKVLIVDWDVHHGNGTQKIFLEDPNVLYFSVHRYHGGNYFPYNTGENDRSKGGPNVVGTKKGRGYNINVGWNHKRMGNSEYLAVWKFLLMPVAREFQPDLVLISAGFDAAAGDIGECDVTPDCFSKLTLDLMSLASGKIVCALEGGYIRSVLMQCIESVIIALLDGVNDESSCENIQINSLKRKHHCLSECDLTLDSIDPNAAKSLQATINAHKPFWKNLNICSSGIK